MNEFPSAVPEIPVTDLTRALDYYEEKLGFHVDWGRGGGGIAGISQGRSRLFLTSDEIRDYFRTRPPVVIWLNLESNADVDDLHDRWSRRGASILHPPESKEGIRLHEFIATDPDGNFLRAFHQY